MASALIHIAVANEINKTLNMKKEELLLGSIAPDLAKIIGETKHQGHFLTPEKRDIPNLDIFLNKYNIDKPYEMGYYIHLYTDKIWFENFLPKYYNKTQLRLVSGEFIELPFEEKLKLIYQDYSSLNIKLKRKYNLDLDFLNKKNTINTEIIEIPANKLDKLQDNVNDILLESIELPMNVFKEDEIDLFIETCIKEIIKDVQNDKHIISK